MVHFYVDIQSINQSFVNGAVIQSYAALSQRLWSTGSHQSNESANR